MNPVRLIYIANARIPTEKAHGIQIMKMCEAFSRQGAEVELVVPRRFNPIKKDSFEYYSVEKNFKITKVPSVDLVKFGKIGFWIQSFSFSKFAAIYVLFKNRDIVYSRDALPLFWLSFFRRNIFWEAHRGEFNFIVKRLLKKGCGIITITQGLKDFYIQNGADGDKILVASDGVDLKKFNIEISKEEARKKVGLSQDKKIVLYTGHLYNWKGADILAEASRHFDSNILTVFVGGTEGDIKKFKIKNPSPKILIVGRRPHQEIPYWLKSADVLVLPNSAKEKISKFYTSPIKMFEYMAAKRPIVASDLPSIREILNDPSTGHSTLRVSDSMSSGQGNAVFFKPDDIKSLVLAIDKVLRDDNLANELAVRAFIDVQGYTWEERALKIINFYGFHV